MKTAIRHGLLVSVVILIIFSSVGGAAAAPAADGPNLLQNPGFEAPYAKQCCHTEPGFPANQPIDEVQVAWGWRAWWLQPGDPQHPSSGANPAWHRPEYREANCGAPCANRIRSGSDAQKYFTFWSVHDAGMYQQVSGVTPGALLRFSVYMQAWSVNANAGLSDYRQIMNMRVGIDPFGGTDAFSPNIVWSTPFDTYDTWGLYSIEATASNGTVTVFTRSNPLYGNQHNDIYVDDASLVVVGAGQPNNPPAPQPTVAPPPTQAPAPVPGFTYVVQPGDNYFSIAQRFGVSESALLQANNVTNPRVLFVGTVLIIPSNNPPPGPAPTTPPSQLPNAFAYTVQPGDNLFRIGLRFGISVARIKQLNNLVSDIIFVGQTLIIAP